MSDRSLRLEVILQAIDKVTGPLKKITGGSSAAARAVKAASDELKNLQRGQRDIARFKDLQAGLRGTSERLNAAQQHLREMQAQMRAGGGDTNKFRRDFTKAHEAVRDLTRRVQEQRKELAPHAQKLREAGIGIAKLGTHESELTDKINAATAALDKQKRTLEAVGIARGRYARAMATRDAMASAGVRLGATGAAIGGATSIPVRAYAEAEDAATQLRVAMMRAGGQVAAEYARINELAMRLGDRLPGTTAEFQNMMTMLIRQGMAPKAILGGLGEATAYLGVQLKMSSEEAAEFAAKLQDATRTAEGDMMGLMDVIQRSFYVGVDKNNMLNAFAKLAPALDTIRVKGLAGAKALAPLVAMADQAGMQGEASGNALRKVLQSGMNTEKVQKALADLQKAKGVALKLDFTDGKGEFGGLDRLFQQLGQLKSLTTENRLALIKDIYGDDAEVTQIVSLLIEKGKAGYEDMLGKMAGQADIQHRVNEQLGTLKNLWEAATGTFTNFMVALGESISPELKAITAWLGNVASAARQFAVEHPVLTSGIMKTVGALGMLTAGLGAALLGLAAVAAPFAALRYGLALTSIMTGGLVPKLLAIAKTALPAIGRALMWVGRLFLANPIGLAVTAIGGAAYLIYRYWAPIRGFFSRLWDGIKATVSSALDWFASLPARFERLGLDIMLGLSRGISNAMASVKGAITGAATSAVGWFKDILGIHSPSRVFAELGGYTMDGLALGLQRNGDSALEAVLRTTRRITAASAVSLGGMAMPAVAAQAPNMPSLPQLPVLTQAVRYQVRDLPALGSDIRIDNRPPLAASSGRGSAPMNVNYTVNISAAPGTDENALRKLFREELDRHKHELAARARSRLIDLD